MTKPTKTASPTPRSGGGGLPVLLLSLGVVFLLLFQKSFQKGQALLSNDGPLAVQVAENMRLPGTFLGIWNDLYWLGAHTGNFAPNVTGLELLLLGPYGYTNFHLPVAFLILACCAWFYFRVLGFSALTCVLGGLAAALNGNFFSNGAWGLSSRGLSLGMTFLALAAVTSSFRSRPWLKTILAGLAIGMSISEGGDNGALFSLFVAAYAFALTLFHGGVSVGAAARGIGRVLLMAVCAAVLAVQTLNLFVNVAVKDVVGAKQDEATKVRQWDFATQWSLPKAETLRVLIPGLYGYRMDTPEGGHYRGSVGQSAAWTPGSQLVARHSGAGEYAGMLVVLLALWTLAQAARGDKSTFNRLERKQVFFWAGAAGVALVFAWGRYAPFYQFVYALPYLSTIRNPMKFMHAFHMALMILFAFGVQGLARLYLGPVAQAGHSFWARFQASWTTHHPFERRWTLFCFGATAVSALTFLIYSTMRIARARGLTKLGFGETEAEMIARFSAIEVGWFLVFLVFSVVAVLAVQSGWFAGRKARWAGWLLGLVLVVDLARSNLPWIIYYDYTKRYASNPVLDVLKEKPYEHRVTVVPFGNIPQLAGLQQFYNVEWLQHHFQFYNIQALDVAQEPRLVADKDAYLKAVGTNMVRYWQLTNARYLIGLSGGFLDAMNDQLAPQTKPFTQRLAFAVSLRPSGAYSTFLTNTGPFALIEMTNALPRAQLYSHWETSTNQEATLRRLFSPDFDPQTSVIVSHASLPAPAAASADATSAPGHVEFLSYSPRRIMLKAQASAPSILLLNDRFHPSWRVLVDGQPQEMLRCNFIMRGVQIPPGNHEVTFQFAMAPSTFKITLASVLAGLVLCSFLAFAEYRDSKAAPR